MEIERKFVVKNIPFQLDEFKKIELEQAYISTNPVIRVRKSDLRYILTVKSKGLLARQEFELDIEEASYNKLLTKADGNVISKVRYLIPTEKGLVIELDVFKKSFDGLIYAEVEFSSSEEAEAYQPPKWFYKDVTMDSRYHNSSLSQMDSEKIPEFIKNAIL